MDACRVVFHGDLLARILSYLSWREVVTCRTVAAEWRSVQVPVQEWTIRNAATAATIHAASKCLPALQGFRYTQHQNSDPPLTDAVLQQVLSQFNHLRVLHCAEATALTTALTTVTLPRTLQTLNLHNCSTLAWNLACTIVAVLPLLTDLRVVNNRAATGQLQDLLPYTQQLNVLDISGCRGITGNLMDLADFTLLKWIGLNRTSVRGDVRDIILRQGPRPFQALQWLGLDDQMYGASTIDKVADAPVVMQARHIIWRQSSIATTTTPIFPILVRLAETSPDYHERVEQRLYSSERDPPFWIQPVVAATRRGWRWSNLLGGSCRVHWLDPEPIQKNDSDSLYLTELAEIEQETRQSLFGDLDDPPTPAQYEQLCREKS